MKKLLLLSATTCISAYASLASAQVIPGTAAPDLRQRQLEIKDVKPTVSNKPLISVDEQKPVRDTKSGLKFTLKSIAIENNTVFTKGELETVYKDLIGTEVTVGQLNKTADDITAYYRNKGYILTRAVVPPQEIKSGNVKIRIVEGFINDVKIQGDDVANDKILRGYADKIRAEKPLNVENLERYLLLMEDLPGVEARAVLQASPTTPGASDVVVNIKRKPIEASAIADNRGSRFLGPEQLNLTVAFNNLINQDDQTQFRVVNTPFGIDELFFGEIRHEEQLGSEGTKAVFSGSYIKTHPGHTLEPFDVVGTSYAFSAGLSHPVIRSRRENLFVNADATIRDSDLNSLGSGLSHDKTRVLGFATSYDFVDFTSAINRADFRYARGIGFATDVEAKPRSRANGQPVFDKFTTRLSRIQPITGPWSVEARAAGQYSPDPLVASEEFAIGGADFGSAYDPAEITGDSGAAGRLEIQFNQAPQQNYLKQYQVYGFYDIGRVWNHDPIAGSEQAVTSLSSTGLGVRFNVNEQISGGLEGALPLTRKVAAYGADGADPRLFVSMQYRY